MVSCPNVSICEVAPQHVHLIRRDAKLSQEGQGLLNREGVEVILEVQVYHIKLLLAPLGQLYESLQAQYLPPCIPPVTITFLCWVHDSMC